MQLTGPPTFDGWQAPMPTARQPLEGSFERDEDVETYVKRANGTLRRVGDRHYRGRWRSAWDALSYETAHDIITRVSRDPVTVVPRTRRDGDVDFISEQAYECRTLEGFPATTPVGRRAGGEKIARVEVQLETLTTITEAPSAGV